MNILRFEDVDIHCYGDMWFSGRDVLAALEYPRSNVLYGKISPMNKKRLSELNPSTVFDRDEIYISYYELHKFVLASDNPKAPDFELFLESFAKSVKEKLRSQSDLTKSNAVRDNTVSKPVTKREVWYIERCA